MAYYEDDDQEQLDPNAPNQGEQGVGSESGIISGQDGMGAAGAAKAPASVGSTGVAKNFTGIQDYISANRPQTQKLANNVGGYINQLGEGARSTLAQNQNLFNQDVDKNTIGLNQPLFDEAKTNATNVAGNQQKLADFVRMRDASYQGPASFETSNYYQPTQQAVDKAITAAKNTEGEAGQRQLLTQFQQASRNRVNPGALTFDSALLQSDPTARQVLGDARAKQAGLGTEMSTAIANALTKAQQGAKTTADTKNAVQNTFAGNNSIQKQLENQIQGRVGKEVQTARDMAESLKTALKQAPPMTTTLKPSMGMINYSDNDLGLLDIDRSQYDKYRQDLDALADYGDNSYYDLSRYAQVNNPTGINAQNIATKDDYAKYAALNQLMGTNNSFLSDPNMSGKADMDALDFNYNQLYQDMQRTLEQKKQQAAAGLIPPPGAPKASNNLIDKAMALAGSNPVTQPAAAVAAPVVNAAKKIFCFLEGTPIAMADGSYKSVHELQIGDHVLYGQMVIATGVALCDQLIEYKGAFTSPSHAIFDGSEWKRAKDIEGAVEIECEFPVKVYPITVEEHILVSDNEVVYADFVELDHCAGLSAAHTLSELNDRENIKRAKKIEQELKGE